MALNARWWRRRRWPWPVAVAMGGFSGLKEETHHAKASAPSDEGRMGRRFSAARRNVFKQEPMLPAAAGGAYKHSANKVPTLVR